MEIACFSPNWVYISYKSVYNSNLINRTTERRKTMLQHAYQTSIFDIDSDIDNLTSNSTFKLFDLFDQFINLEELIPLSFYRAYNSKLGRSREFPLEGMIKAYIISQMIGLPTNNLLILIINLSSEFRRFLGFKKHLTSHSSLDLKQDTTMSLRICFTILLIAPKVMPIKQMIF